VATNALNDSDFILKEVEVPSEALVAVSSHSTQCQNKEHHNPNATQPHISHMRQNVSVIQGC